MRIINLASGSKGNVTLIENDSASILIDAGLSIKDLEERLLRVGARADNLSAILVSHNHIDHIRSVARLANKYKIPVFASRECYEDAKLAKVLYELKNEIGIEDFNIGSIKISTFEVPHDALKTIGFVFYADGNKIAHLTDVGALCDNVFNKIAGSNLIMIESNYDEEMLNWGPYPEKLKRRIKSNMGHLSNRECSHNILKLSKLGTKFFMLMHLSEINNTPEIAYNNVMNILHDEYGDDNEVRVFVANQYDVSSNFILKSKLRSDNE